MSTGQSTVLDSGGGRGPGSSTESAPRAAPYGKACTNCSKSKCKCILREGGGSCERCHRLGKECQASVSVRRRASRRPALSRTAQLEEKLDSLVNLIRANGVAGTARLSSTQELLVRQGGDDVSNARPSSQLVAPVEDGPAHPEQPHHQQGRQQCRVPPTPSASTPEPHPTSPAGLDNHRFDGYDVSISDEEAEEALRNFREQKLCHLPIIMVRPEETAAEFRATKPFLWLSILAVTDRCTSRQVAHGVKFREELARKLFVEQERSPEMLYAVLVYLGWAMYHVFGKPFLGLFSNSALTLVQDLGLNKPLNAEISWHATNPFKPYQPKSMAATKERSKEHRRAILATYLVLTTVNFFFNRPDPIQWTAYMEECLSILAREPECEGDEVLVSQIRFQRVCLEAIHNPWRTPDLVTGWEMPTGGEVSAQIHCLIKLLTARLEEAKRQVPEHLRENKIILLHQHTATTVIHELIIWTLPAPSGYQPPQVSASAMDTTPATEAAGPAAGDTSPHATRSGSSHYYRQPSVNTPVPAPPSPTLTSLPTMSGSSASSPPSRQPAPVRTLPPEALPSLLAIMSSTSAWFDTFFSITPRVMAGVSFGSWGQFGSAVQVLYKLATLDLEGWDRGLALRRGGKDRLRSASDSSTSTSNAGAMQYWGITEALETMADRLARVGAEAGLYSGDVDAARALLQGGGGRPAAAVRKCRLGAGRATNFDRPTPTNTATTITMSPGATPSLSSTTTMATPTPQTVQCAPGLGSPDEDGADFFTLDLFTRAAKTMRLLLLAWAPVLEAGCGSKDGQATQQPSDLQTGASTHGQGAMGPLPRGLHAPLQVRADGIGVPDIGNNSDVHMTAGDEGSVSTFPHSRTMAQPPEEASVDPVSLPLSGQSWISTGPAPIIPPEHVQDQDSQQHHLHQQHGFGFGGEFFQLDDAWLSNMFVTWESLMK